MNQKFLSGFTATLLMVSLGVLPSYAEQSEVSSEATDASSAVKVSTSESALDQAVSDQGISTGSSDPRSAVQPAAVQANLQPSDSQPQEAVLQPQEAVQEPVKVGEYQSQQQASPDETITIIHSHELAGRRAATLYVRNIPVLTFLGAATTTDAATNPSSANPADANSAAPKSSASALNAPIDTPPPDTKVASIQNRTLPTAQATSQPSARSNAMPNAASAQPETDATDPHDPMWRATAIAARLNQLHQDNVDANTITVAWDEQQRCYMIKAGKEALVQMTDDTILPHTTQNPTEDALQATNLIRRQVGNAPPLQSVTGAPEATSRSGTQISLGPVRLSVSGMASWYGPGFDGASSASGETFNQNALTAAHPNLPFGTQVRVTNLDNGTSVVVRINDRGPYAGDRIIDLSRGAAAVIGLVQSGVAPVKLEVLDSSASR